LKARSATGRLGVKAAPSGADPGGHRNIQIDTFEQITDLGRTRTDSAAG